MKKWLLILPALIILSGLAAAQFERVTYGKLSVYSDVQGADIYVDAKFVGQDRASITNIPTGKHYVRVVKGKDTIQSGIVRVVEGEETIIVAKPKAERLETRRRKPNYVFFYGSMTDLGYSETISGATITYPYSPQLGFGAEIQFNVPQFDLRMDAGFSQNYPAGIQVSATQEANMAVSTPYLNLTKNILGGGLYKINIGAGINYGIFSPGYKTLITIASRIGYQAFLELIRSSGKSSHFLVRVGYTSLQGQSAAPGEVTAAGLYVRGGVAYQL